MSVAGIHGILVCLLWTEEFYFTDFLQTCWEINSILFGDGGLNMLQTLVHVKVMSWVTLSSSLLLQIC